MGLIFGVLSQDGWNELQAFIKERGLLGAVEELRARKPKTDKDENMLVVAEYLLSPTENDEPELMSFAPEYT